MQSEDSGIGIGEVATNESDRLTASERVEEIPVYNSQGERLGSVYNMIIDKNVTRGQVVYAIVSFGGFLGIGEVYHPLPWEKLTYDTRQTGYIVDVERTQLKHAPSFGPGDLPNWSDTELPPTSCRILCERNSWLWPGSARAGRRGWRIRRLRQPQ